MEESLDLRGYFNLLLRRWWVFALCLGLGMVGGWLFDLFQESSELPIYQSTAKLLIQGGARTDPLPTGDPATNQLLAQYYEDLVKTRPFLEQVGQKLPQSLGPDALSDKIFISRPSTMIEITARDEDPMLAAQIANTTAATLIEDLRDRQLNQIAQDQAALSQYGIAPDPSITAARLAGITTLSVAEQAIESRTPIGSGLDLSRLLLLAGVISMLIAGGIVFTLEQLDDRIRNPDDLNRISELPTLATVFRRPNRKEEYPLAISAEGGQPETNVPEAYKFLMTNLEFAALGMDQFKRLLVTSSTPLEGKTTTALNLAISFARKGESVILIDSDLRRPDIHRILNLENKIGLTSVLVGNNTLDEVLMPTATEGLRILPTGPLPPDPTRLLQPSVVKDTFVSLDAVADLLIFDSPPLLAVADALILASSVDGVILVIDSQKTGERSVKRSIESLQQSSVTLLGGVLNKVSHGDRGHGYYYYYYHYYYSQDGSGVDTNGNPSLISRILKLGRASSKGKTAKKSSKTDQI